MIKTAEELRGIISDIINNHIYPTFKEKHISSDISLYIQTKPFQIDNEVFPVPEEEDKNWLIKKEMITHVAGFSPSYSINKKHPFYLYLWMTIQRYPHLWHYGLSADDTAIDWLLSGFNVLEQHKNF